MCEQHLRAWRRGELDDFHARANKPVRADGKCLVSNCIDPYEIKGLCKSHYYKQWTAAKNSGMSVPNTPNTGSGAENLATKATRNGQQRVDFAGMKFGKVSILRPNGLEWVCTCDCNPEIEFLRTHHKLLQAARNSRNTSTCGKCYQHGSREAIVKSQYKSYKGAAATRGYCFLLSEEEFGKLIFSPCVYCGSNEDKFQRGYNFVGVDRKDNGIGYTTENSVPCCWMCNAAKGAHPYNTWVNWLKRIANVGVFPTP